LDREIKATRFPPLAAALQAFEGGKAMDIIPNLIKSIDQMFEAHRYVGYLRYNLGDPEIGQYVPYLDQIQDNHYRLTIALTDIAYVTSRAGVNAFEPLLKYVDKVAENGYDEKTHQKEIQDHVREGGRRLAIDFFSLPETIDRACWYCGSTTTATVTKVAETTTWGLADLLGSVAVNWKPTSKEDAKPKFIEAFKEPLNAFISDRVKTFVTAVRKSTANIIAQQLFSVIGNGIDSITNTINDLCKALPNPIGDNLKAGDMVKYLLIKMANNCVTIGVKMLAKKLKLLCILMMVSQKLSMNGKLIAYAGDQEFVIMTKTALKKKLIRMLKKPMPMLTRLKPQMLTRAIMLMLILQLLLILLLILLQPQTKNGNQISVITCTCS